MSMVVRTVVAIPLLIFLSTASWAGWTMIDPIAAQIMAESSTPSLITAVLMLVSLGFRFVFPGLAVVIVGWWIFGSLRTDARFRRGRVR